MKNLTIILTVLLAACTQQPQETPEAILAQMRADTSWIHRLDSLAQAAIGPGAKCLDPVAHTFSFDGRTWLFNQDWGGVLEIPSDYYVEDGIWQANFTFHGTRAWSPDSLILVSFYAGFQALSREETIAGALTGLEKDGFAVQVRDEKEGALSLRARSAEGINYYGRHCFVGDTEYAVSVQYPDEKADEAQKLIEMADHYPAGPNGTIFPGEAQ